MQKKISEEICYKGSIFQVSHDEVEIENGMHTYRDVVHHHGGVGVLMIDHTKVLLVSQYRYAIHEQTWEIPAGKLEAMEDPYTCGLREVEEECGYLPSHMEQIVCMYSTPGFCSEQITIYECHDFTKVEHPRPMDEDECIETAWFSIQDAYGMVKDGGIKDAKTIIAIQHAVLSQK